MKSSLEELKQISGLEIKNLQLFHTALTHSSYVHEQQCKESNERLEYLGDAVLDLIIGEFLYQKFPHWPEGSLSRVRASLVRESVLAAVSRTLQLGEHLRMGRGEEQSGGREKNSILADAFESLLGAVYLDSGLEGSRVFIEKVMKKWLDDAETFEKKLPDSKTRLQELLQVNGTISIQYQVEMISDPNEEQFFKAILYVNGERISEGDGRNKKESEQSAAARALETLEEQENELFK